MCVRGSWRPNRAAIYWPPLSWPSALCLSRSPDAQPEARRLSFLLSAGFLYHILSPTSGLNRSPKGPFCRWWPSLPHLVTNSSHLQHTAFPSSPSHIIVQSPTQYLWNGMFDRHQAEITVMQFTGHSLPVHQSMTVHWDFNLSHIVSQCCLRDFFP